MAVRRKAVVFISRRMIAVPLLSSTLCLHGRREVPARENVVCSGLGAGPAVCGPHLDLEVRPALSQEGVKKGLNCYSHLKNRGLSILRGHCFDGVVRFHSTHIAFKR